MTAHLFPPANAKEAISAPAPFMHALHFPTDHRQPQHGEAGGDRCCGGGGGRRGGGGSGGGSRVSEIYRSRQRERALNLEIGERDLSKYGIW